MEPDSSTDLSLTAGHPPHQVPINEAKPAANQQPGGEQRLTNQSAEQEDEDELELEHEKMFHNSRHFAQALGAMLEKGPSNGSIPAITGSPVHSLSVL